MHNIAKVSKAHIPPAVAIRGHTALRQKADYRKRYVSSHPMNIQVYCPLLQRQNIKVSSGVDLYRSDRWEKQQSKKRRQK